MKATLTTEQRQRLIDDMNGMVWYHRIELAPGIVTTPRNDWEEMWAPMRARHREVDFRGKRVLEVGCWDGYWSFEAERLGAAEVWATDDMSQRKTVTRTVPFAIEALGSGVRYRDDVSVYELARLFAEPFDLVIFYGVLYHLRYPVLALAQLRSVLKPGGLLLVETAALLDTEEATMRWGHRDIYPLDPSTWNAPSPACLRLLLETSYFRVDVCEIFMRQYDERRIGRCYAQAVAIEAPVPDPHIVPDHFLRRYGSV